MTVRKPSKEQLNVEKFFKDENNLISIFTIISQTT